MKESNSNETEAGLMLRRLDHLEARMESMDGKLDVVIAKEETNEGHLRELKHELSIFRHVKHELRSELRQLRWYVGVGGVALVLWMFWIWPS